jgi:hypothetical protein
MTAPPVSTPLVECLDEDAFKALCTRISYLDPPRQCRGVDDLLLQGGVAAVLPLYKFDDPHDLAALQRLERLQPDSEPGSVLRAGKKFESLSRVENVDAIEVQPALTQTGDRWLVQASERVQDLGLLPSPSLSDVFVVWAWEAADSISGAVSMAVRCCEEESDAWEHKCSVELDSEMVGLLLVREGDGTIQVQVLHQLRPGVYDVFHRYVEGFALRPEHDEETWVRLLQFRRRPDAIKAAGKTG